MAELKQSQLSIPATSYTDSDRRIVVGIYGIPGSGKSTLLDLLKQKLDSDCFAFYEGSELIASMVPGGLEAFKALSESGKVYWRQLAIKSVASKDIDKKVVVIVGHYMFWKEEEEAGTPVITEDDLRTYTHIVYLDVPANIVVERRKYDILRNRPKESASHLDRWQQTEKADLRRLCYDNSILFSVVPDGPQLLHQVLLLLQNFQYLTEAKNNSVTRAELDEFFASSSHQWKTLLFMDADRTLTADDTGEMFWETFAEKWPSKVARNPLKEIFGGKMQYSHTAFHQAMLLYEEILDEEQFNDVCKIVASATTMYPEFISLLQAVAEQDQTGAIIITCGLRQVWEKVLERHGLSNRVKVIGGGRLANGFVVTGETKMDLISHAKDVHNAYVCAFGDSPLDLGMLKKADQAIIIVGDEQVRSKSMESALLRAIENDDLRAYQVVLPITAAPRLNLDKLPAIQLTEPKLIEDIIRLQPRRASLEISHATSKNAAKLLMTPMRDANIAGPDLRNAHQRVGRYLATEILSDISGVEEYMIPHVQGHEVAGYRLLHEEQTLIVPLMRGGEPMALGVNDALPGAMFLHANNPEDIRHEHMRGRLRVILVDSVVNTGKSILEFVRHIRRLHATICIVVMAGVVQSGAVSILNEEACCHLNFHLITLRLSDNKFTGSGGTDTGNRLFNTPHLD